ncbi:AAA family ATPase [Sphingomonas melonis]|uniref:AAA family ATPase n=1 Tax=Sphingomonas melonis TaxID=152682 RepID=UPI0035C7B809
MEVVVNNSPSEIEARSWLNAHKDENGLSWPQIGKLTDVASSTLSLFATGKYVGNNENIAAKVLAYRGRLTVQEAISADLPMVPVWYDTATSTKLTSLLRWAQSGKIVLIVTSPGIGKTRTAERFEAADANVWLATMAPSTAGVATMLIEIAAAIGLGEVKGSPQQLARQIKTRIRGRKGLLIIDEAQELTDKALNELRSLHDQTGVGIALLGNETVVGQLDTRKSALAQISSRFSIKHVQAAPIAGDLDALFEAWGIADAAQKTFLAKIGALPGALREVTNTIEIALMASFGTGEALSLGHLRDAARQRNVKLGAL